MTRKDALEIFEENLPEIKESIEVNFKYQLANLEKPQFGDYGMYWVTSNLHQLQVEMLNKKYKPILRAIEVYLRPTADGELNVEKAKEFPIEGLLEEEPVRGMVKCPLHHEKTPSCQIKNNRFTCYGCGEYGDVIDLYMKLKRVPFVEAVKALSS